MTISVQASVLSNCRIESNYFFPNRNALARSAREPLPSPKKGKLHIRPRTVGQSFTLGSEVVRCVSWDSHRAFRAQNLFVRKSTLIVRKCLELRRTLRIRVISCRRMTFNVSFCVSYSEAICGVETASASSAECKTIALECHCLSAWLRVVVKIAANDIVVFFRYSYR